MSSISGLSASYGVAYSTRRSAASGAASSTGSSAPAETSADSKPCTTSGSGSLTPEQQKQVEELKKRDTEVRSHEAAHLAAAGAFAKGGPVFNYQTGPDGRSYAVGGHVNIDTSAIAGNPRATLAKAQQVQRAALAPADPSAQDQSVAASASAQAAKALAEIAKQSAGGGKSDADGQSTEGTSSGASAKGRTNAKSSSAVKAYAKTSEADSDSGGGLNTLG